MRGNSSVAAWAWSRSLAIVACFVCTKSGPGDDAKPTPKPATFAEFKAAIDFDAFKKPADAVVEHIATEHLTYSTGASIAEAAEFCRKQLLSLGWTEKRLDLPATLVAAKYALAGYEKGDFHVTLSVSAGQEPKKVNVFLSNNGNVDPARFPRPADAKIKNSLRANLTYTTALAPAEVESLLRKEMPATGWKEEADESAAFHRKEGRYILNYIQNAMKLMVVAYKDKEGVTQVSYFPQLREHAELLANAATAKVATAAKFEDAIRVIDLRQFARPKSATKTRRNSAGVYYECDETVKDEFARCKSELEKNGWKESKQRVLDLDDRIGVHFERDGYCLNLFAAKNSRTGKTEVSIANEGNVNVADLPRPDDARVVIAEFANLHYSTGLDRAATARYCKETLAKLGWKERAGQKGSQETERAIVLKLVQNAVQLTIEIQTSDNRTRVHIFPRLIGAP